MNCDPNLFEVVQEMLDDCNYDQINEDMDTEYMISKTETKLGAIITYTPTNPNA